MKIVLEVPQTVHDNPSNKRLKAGPLYRFQAYMPHYPALLHCPELIVAEEWEEGEENLTGLLYYEN